ncbi:MAG: hypothetical protein NTU83_04800 [Candidatus Hydrogenedentes bacterium]|nr:hypothetical protein [Candidatus Hydrogenedentota bacterium]
MDKAVQMARRIEKIKKVLADLGDMRPGSLSTQTRSWGGQYGQLSYTHLGKGHTEYVPPERVKEVKRQIDNYRKFKELTQEWVTLAIELCTLKHVQDGKEETQKTVLSR